LGISLEDAQEATRIRIRYLEALEGEDFEALPNAVVARGFLRNYADYLEMDAQEAAERFNRIADAPKPEPLSVDESSPFETDSFRPVALHEIERPRARWWLLAGLLVILVAALAWLVWMGYPTIENWLSGVVARAEPTPTRQSTSEPPATATRTATTAPTTDPAPLTTVPAAAASEQPTPTLEITLTPTFTPSPSPSPTEPIYTGIFLELVFDDTSWIQVTVDGVRQFQGELETGTYRSWYGEQRIELRVGNAGVVQVTVNGQEFGTLGEPGEVVDRIFEIVDDEVTEATPTSLPPGTLTAEATAGTPLPEPTFTVPAATAPPATSTAAITTNLSITVTATVTPTVLATATTNP
jgi:cytoskeletal protein RodZ